MSDTKRIKVQICSETIELVGAESEEYINTIARYINQKFFEIQKRTKSVSVNSNLMNLLVSINIADELLKEKDANQQLSEELRACSAELALKLEENRKLEELLGQVTSQLKSLQSEFQEYIDTFK